MEISVHERGKHDPHPSSGLSPNSTSRAFHGYKHGRRCYNSGELTQEKSLHDFRIGNKRQGCNEVINQTTLKLDLFHQKLSPQRATKADNDDRKRCLQHVGFVKLLKMKQKQTNKKNL